MRIVFFFIILITTSGTLYSQQLSVKDSETGEPLQNATIMSSAPEAFATTNDDGHADVSSFRNAEQITIRMLGYRTLNSSWKDLQEASFRLSLDPKALTIDEVVVSAARWRQNSSDIPSRVINISPDEIALQNPQSAADLLNVSGKVFIQKSQQGGGSPMIRGFATNRLLYTVDGVRMNTAIFRGGNIQNIISLDPFATENTEVLFGPGAVIYGSDAIGGVMSFSTLTPQFSEDDKTRVSGNAVTRYSSANNEKTGHFDVNIGWKKWAMVTSISSNDYGDLKMGSHGPDAYLKPYYVEHIDSTDVVVRNKNPELQRPSGYSQHNLMQKVRFRPDESWELDYGLHYSETSSYGRYDRSIRTRDNHPRYGQWDYGPQKWMMNNLSATHHTANPFFNELSLRIAHQYFEESRIDRDFNAVDQRNRIEKVDAYSANLDFSKTYEGKNQLYYGAEWILNDVNSTAFNKDIYSGNTTAIGTRYPQSNWASYALYVNGQYELSDKMLLHGGMRYNQFTIDADFDTTFYDLPHNEAHINKGALTGNVGITYRPVAEWVLKANLSTAFRAPNIDDMGKIFDSEPGAVVVPNPELDAEYAYNADIGLARVFGDVLKVDLTAFYTTLEDAMVRRDFTLDGRDSIRYDGVMSRVQAIQNAATANVYGVQAGFEAKLPSGFSVSSDFNYQHGEEELDDGTVSPSRHAAPWFGVTRVTYRTRELHMELYSQYSGKVAYEDLAVSEQGKPYLYAPDGEGNHYSPAWYTLNLKGSYQLTENMQVSGGIENITDQRYRTYSSGIAAAGRNFVLSLKARF